MSHINTIIIGAGDVVQNRLFPALVNSPHLQSNNIRIFAKDANPELELEFAKQRELHPDCKGLPEKVEPIDNLPAGELESPTIVWIATPSDAHFEYVERFSKNATLLVVEKPMTNNLSDLEKYEQYIQTPEMNKTFFLSYYLLEKALPLAYLKSSHRFYEYYLYCKNIWHPNLTLYDIPNIFKKLGELKFFHMTIQEESDYRTLPEGGQLLETFIHHCILASLYVGLPNTWEDVHWNISSKDLNASDIKIYLQAKSNQGVDISLSLVKGSKRKTQGAVLEFEHGYIFADFDKKEIELSFNDGRSYIVGVKDEFKNKYTIQTNMAYTCAELGFPPATIDGFTNQIDIIKWLNEEIVKM